MNRLSRPNDESWGQLKAKIKSADEDSANEAKILINKLKSALNNRTITITKDSNLPETYKSKKKV